MKHREMFTVVVEVEQKGFRYVGVGHFNRMPTLEELVDSYLSPECFAGNEKNRPGITEAVIGVLMRSDLPMPPPEVPPNVEATLKYADGIVSVTRTLHTNLDED